MTNNIRKSFEENKQYTIIQRRINGGGFVLWTWKRMIEKTKEVWKRPDERNKYND